MILLECFLKKGTLFFVYQGKYIACEHSTKVAHLQNHIF